MGAAIRLLELYRKQAESRRAATLACDIERWLDEGGPKLDELRERFAQIATAEGETE